jgi:hypothetical protein
VTDYLNFTTDFHRDITINPGEYHKFSGKSLRIQCYWASEIWNDYTSYMRSSAHIESAAQVLRKYTLDIDVKPFRAPAEFAAAFKGKIADAKKGLLKSPGSYYTSFEGGGGPNSGDSLRNEIGTPVELNRLIVVFAALNGPASGLTVLKPDWLPWVIVDPRVRGDTKDDSSETYTAIHEIGHACRLGHCLDSWEPMATMTPDPDYLANLMLRSGGLGYLWGWQVDEIFDSYWCNGPSPNNWWTRPSGLGPHIYMWEK